MEFKVCSLFSGSSGNATYIGTNNTHILVDAGLAGKNILSGLKGIGVDGNQLNGILVTHEHLDHIRGVGVLSRKCNIPIYANLATWQAMENRIGPIRSSNIRVFESSQDFYVQDINIEPYNTPHDAADPVGFSFYSQNKKISIATDLGHTNKKIINTVMDSDLVILEANHDVDMLKSGPYPQNLKKRILGGRGHLSNEAAAHTILDLIKGKVTHVLLAHLSNENNYPQLAYQTVVGILEENGVRVGHDISIDMTYRNRAGNFYHIG